MTKRILLSFLILNICACNKINEKEDEKNINKILEAKKITKVNNKPLFLNLSPKMSDKDFENQIKKLENTDQLYEGLFTLDSKIGFDFGFAVSKTKYSIRLYTKSDYIRNFKDLDYNGWRKFILELESKKDEILDIYSKKYKKSKIKFPENFRSQKFDLFNKSYNLFENDEKFVLVSYTISPSIEDIKKKFNKTENSLNYETENAQNDEFDEFLEIQIDYFEKDLIDSIISSNITVKKLAEPTKEKSAKINNEEKI